MVRRAACALIFVSFLSSLPVPVWAADAPAIDLPALAADAAKRYPQPVRVGDLLGQDVLQPIESQPVLGHVAAMVRRPDGGLDMIIHYGGVFGLDTHPIAVPVEAVASVGPSVAVMGFTPAQLDRFPTVAFPHVGTLAPDDQMAIGIVRPFH